MRPLVLNTRSKNQLREFTELLIQAGFDSLEIPALEISKIEASNEIVSLLNGFERDDMVAFTSANAAIIAVQDPVIKEQLTKCRVSAIGDKTAGVLRENGITVHLQSKDTSSEDLGNLIAHHLPKRVLYVSGIPNTGTLRTTLSDKCDFTEIPVYQSSPSKELKRDLIENKGKLKEVQYLTFLSKEALYAFHDGIDSLGESPKEKVCVVISTRVAEAAKLLGYQNIIISQARSVEAIVATLVSSSSAPG